MLYTIIEEELYDRQYVQANTEGFEDLQETGQDYSPEKMEEVCGIEAATIREVARTYATARTSIIFWGMGISQHVHGTDNSRCLISLALITGQVGTARHRPASLARPEQRAGRVRCGPDPHVLSRLPLGREGRGARVHRILLGQTHGSEARPDRGGDHQRDPRRPDQGHVHHGREPGHVGPGSDPRPPGAGHARITWWSRTSS